MTDKATNPALAAALRDRVKFLEACRNPLATFDPAIDKQLADLRFAAPLFNVNVEVAPQTPESEQSAF